MSGFRSVTGQGVSGTVADRSVLLGNRKLLEEAGVSISELSGKAEQLRRDGQSVMLVAIDGQPAGLLGVADPVKASTREAINLLRKERIRHDAHRR